MKHSIPAALALSLLLAACGGTPVQRPVQSQTLSGRITAMSSDRSSLTVAGTTVKLIGAASVSNASLHAMSSSTAIKKNGKASRAQALSVGQEVTVQEQGGVATEVDVDVELRGTIASVGPTSLVVAGQTVNVDANTHIELAGDDDTAAAAHSLAELAAGNFVEISAQRDASGALLASNIEVKGADELKEDGEDQDTELKGLVSSFDGAAHTFMVNGTAVSYDQADVEGTLANGAQVEVEGSFDATAKVLTAAKVEVEDQEGEHEGFTAGAAVTLEARLDSLDTAAKTFTLKGLKVDYAQATVTGSLTLRAEVKVSGTVDSAGAALVHATAVMVSNDD